MTPSDAIGTYLAELEADLRPGRRRQRIVDEAADHLQDAVAWAVAAGSSEAEATRAAIASFGPAAEVAHRFEVELSSAAALDSSSIAVVALALTSVAQLPAATVDLSTTAPWLTNATDSPLVFLAAQVAIVAGVATGIRWLARRRAVEVDPLHRRLLVRGSWVTLAALAMVQGPELVGALLHLDQVRASRVSVALALSLVPQILLLAVAAAITVTAWRKVAATTVPPSGLDAPAPPPAAEGMTALLADSAVVLETLRAWARQNAAWVGGGESRAAARAAGVLADRRRGLLEVADPRRRPWRFCLAVAAVVGVTVSAGTAIGNGRLGWAIVAVGAVIEGLAVVAGFVLLGGVLGLRPPLRWRRSR